MPQVLQKKWRAVCVWNRYSVSASAPASSSNFDSCTFTISAFLRRQIEQFFKEIKSERGMSRYRLRDFREIEGWVQVCCIAFVYLEWYRLRRRAESEDKEWWWRQRTGGLVLQVQQESEWTDLEQMVKVMETEEGRANLRAGLRRALPLEQRRRAEKLF